MTETIYLETLKSVLGRSDLNNYFFMICLVVENKSN